MAELVEVFQGVGTPVGVLIVMFYFASRTGRFLSPLIERLFQSHVGMFDALKASAEKTTPVLFETHELVGEIHQAVVPDKSK